MKNNVKELRLMVILVGVVMFLGMNYWETDVDNKYECVSFFYTDSEAEPEYVEVIVKGKYGKSIFRGDRFRGRVSVDGKLYPDMLREDNNGVTVVYISSKETDKLAKDNPISQRIIKNSKSSGFIVGYDYSSILGNKYGRFGYLYYDDGMKNIAISVNSYNDDHSTEEQSGYKFIVSKENRLEAEDFIHEYLAFLKLED